MKISVIIPCYNSEKYLRECLDSVISQTLREIEIICVNDGSEDGSLAILEEYARDDERITVVTRENGGAGAARNTGLAIAKGEYLAFLDADDFFERTMLEKMYSKAIECDADIVICRTKGLDTKTKQFTDMSWSIQEMPEKPVFSYKDIHRHFEFSLGWPWDKLFKKSHIDAHMLQFQEIQNSNDSYFVDMAVYKSNRITVLNEILVTHRTNVATSLSETLEKDPLCYYSAIRAIKNELIRMGIFFDVEQRFVNWALTHSFFHLFSLKTAESFAVLYHALQDSILLDIGLKEHPEDYFYNNRQYTEALKILSSPISTYLFDR
jgi:glycosyltransferase involved in cell wall biosynthesis